MKLKVGISGLWKTMNCSKFLVGFIFYDRYFVIVKHYWISIWTRWPSHLKLTLLLYSAYGKLRHCWKKWFTCECTCEWFHHFFQKVEFFNFEFHLERFDDFLRNEVIQSLYIPWACVTIGHGAAQFNRWVRLIL